MRAALVRALESFLPEDPRGVLITGDLGFASFENLRARLGRRFLNAGVAEQNMIGVAAGIAMAKYRPWVYSIAPFLSLRPLEQIRNDLCFQRLPVRLVGNGGGFSYGIMGPTHHALEDLGVLKTLPGLKLFFPSSPARVADAVARICEEAGPTYLRLGFNGHAIGEELAQDARTGTVRYRAGSDLTLVGIGQAASLACATTLAADIFAFTRYPFAWPLETEFLMSLRRTRKLLIVDEHAAAGSIGESLVAELLALPAAGLDGLRIQRLHPHALFGQTHGAPRFKLEQNGLAPADLERAAAQLSSI